jgi:DNA-directed RNA polymerase subunit RPC12/RpoP
MNMQSRHVCSECRRQWVFAKDWAPGMHCPGCGSQHVDLITYAAAFPGADYDPEARPALQVAPITLRVEAERTPLALAGVTS